MALLNVPQHSYNTLWYCSKNLYSKLDNGYDIDNIITEIKSVKLSGSSKKCMILPTFQTQALVLSLAFKV
jgi:hypothetical protein